MSPMKIDPILLEIMGNKVCAIADEMCLTLLRTSRSVFVNEAADFAIALADTEGEVFGWAHENKTTSVHPPCAGTIEAVGALEPGDVIVTNDPYSSRGLSTHLPDLHLIQPYFHQGSIVAYGWAFIHFMDVGGRVPGSITRSNHDIFQEGLRIPPMKLVKKGVLNQDFLRVFMANCRLPEINMRDVACMRGALDVGERRVSDVIAQYGRETFLASQPALKDYAAEKARAVLRRLSDGVYDFWEYLDDDVVSDYPVRVRLRMTVDDGLIHFDLTGTDPAVEAAYNLPTMGTLHSFLTRRITTFVRTHDPTIPLNAGTYRSMSATNPPGTVLNAEYPDAVGERFSSATNFNDAVSGALFKAAPDLMAGPTCGTGCSVILTEFDAAGERSTVTVLQVLRGGMSAYLGGNGVDGRDVTMNTMHNIPLEAMELRSAVRVVDYDIRADSGGAGRWRGGVGQRMTVAVQRDGGILHVRGTEHMRFPAWGVAGGKPGAPFRCILKSGRAGEREVGKAEQMRVNAGDTLTVFMPGAAGYGDPCLRQPADVLRDVAQGFVSRPAAKSEYGVIITDGILDEKATRACRRGRTRDNVHADFDFGPEREAWENAVDDATVMELNRRLYALPKSVRQAKRHEVYRRAFPDMPKAGAGSLAEALRDCDGVRGRFRAAMDEMLDPVGD